MRRKHGNDNDDDKKTINSTEGTFGYYAATARYCGNVKEQSNDRIRRDCKEISSTTISGARERLLGFLGYFGQHISEFPDIQLPTLRRLRGLSGLFSSWLSRCRLSSRGWSSRGSFRGGSRGSSCLRNSGSSSRGLGSRSLCLRFGSCCSGGPRLRLSGLCCRLC